MIKLRVALAIADRGGLPAVAELRIDAVTMSFDARSRLQDAETIEGEVVEDGTSGALAAPGTDDDTEGQPDLA
ncbi:MAG: hypothetical protein V3T48_03850 [Vicinamibacterales bacterium]